MSDKLSKFLLCENPTLNEQHDGRSFILHTRFPMLLAEVLDFEFTNDSERIDFEKKIFEGFPELAWRSYSRLDYGEETFFFRCIWVDGHSEFGMLAAQQQADEMAGIMRRMADWYKSYLIWEDKK